MESKDLIIIICAIIAGACIIAFAIAFVDDFHDDEDDMSYTNCTAENLTNNTTANNTNDNTTYDLSRVVYNTAYIHVDATDTWKRTVETKNSDVLGNILLRFTETNDSIKGSSGQNIPSNGDITDEVIQNYYKYVLEANEPNQIPESITIQRSEETKDGTGAVYGRYLVSWTAPKQDAAHGPAIR